MLVADIERRMTAREFGDWIEFYGAEARAQERAEQKAAAAARVRR